MIKSIFWALLLSTLLSCATQGGLVLDDINRPLAELQHIAAKCLPLGLRHTSANGREFFSHFFVAEARRFKNADREPERRYAQILILGDQRPYRIEVVVPVERTSSSQLSGYSAVGTDKELARVVKKRIQQQLNKRREDLNIIDDFRVF